MTTQELIEGLTILEKYRDKPNGYNTEADRDQIFAYATDLPVNKTDLERLIELGWFQETDEDGFSIECYNVEEGWTCFV